MTDKTREPWWTWHWDKKHVDNATITLDITRWRRGSLLTIYRFKTEHGGVEWWLYGPFNLAIGFGKG
jgi:hypothetical protein